MEPIVSQFNRITVLVAVVLQEVKVQEDRLEKWLACVPGYESFWAFSRPRKGYSGDELVESGRNVVVVGDLNIAHKDIDVHHQWHVKDIYSTGERVWLESMLHKYVDLYRHFHPEVSNVFTVWDQRTDARTENKGLRAPSHTIAPPLVVPREPVLAVQFSGHVHLQSQLREDIGDAELSTLGPENVSQAVEVGVDDVDQASNHLSSRAAEGNPLEGAEVRDNSCAVNAAAKTDTECVGQEPVREVCKARPVGARQTSTRTSQTDLAALSQQRSLKSFFVAPAVQERERSNNKRQRAT
eukprot:SM000093S24414  [mRNA]  locus=s93:149864:152177:- [translate_table: standard]